MLLDTPTTLTPAAVTVAPIVPTTGPAVLRFPGATLLVSPQGSAAAAETALKTLRGFKTAHRRVAWWNATELARTSNADLRSWGRRAVEEGGAEMVVVCGAGGRDLAVGARDAGLALGRVVVCRDEATARNVLGDSVGAGDVVLALGINAESCEPLGERLESRFSRKLAAT